MNGMDVLWGLQHISSTVHRRHSNISSDRYAYSQRRYTSSYYTFYSHTCGGNLLYLHSIARHPRTTHFPRTPLVETPTIYTAQLDILTQHISLAHLYWKQPKRVVPPAASAAARRIQNPFGYWYVINSWGCHLKSRNAWGLSVDRTYLSLFMSHRSSRDSCCLACLTTLLLLQINAAASATWLAKIIVKILHVMIITVQAVSVSCVCLSIVKTHLTLSCKWAIFYPYLIL